MSKVDPQVTLNWRIAMALVLTFIWLLGGFFYISVTVGWSNFLQMPPEVLGGFFEGAFAPLAFLWLVVGYFLQQHELARNTHAIQLQHEDMQRSVEYSARQAEAFRENALHSRQQSFIRVYELVQQQLGRVAGMLFISSQGDTGSGKVSNEAFLKMFADMVRGDPELFSRQFLIINNTTDEDIAELFYGTEVRTRHSDNFTHHFAFVIEEARCCNPDGLLVGAIQSSAHGLLNNLMIEHRPENWCSSHVAPEVSPN